MCEKNVSVKLFSITKHQTHFDLNVKATRVQIAVKVQWDHVA